MGGPKASPEEKKRRIIIAAMRCFQRKGYVNTTVDDIAAEYGRSKGGIYWHYPSKKAILIDLFTYWMDETFRGISAEIAPLKSSRGKLIRMGEYFMESLTEDYGLYSSMMVFWGTAFEDDSMRRMVVDLYGRYDEVVSSILAQGQADGEFTVPDIGAFSTMLIAMVEGMIVRQVMSGSLDLARIGREISALVSRLLPSP